MGIETIDITNFNEEDITQIPEPYRQLGNAAALTKNIKKLNSLSEEQMRTLASRMVEECPEADLQEFKTTIESSRLPGKDLESFHAELSEAFTVKLTIYGLLKPENKNPQQYFSGRDGVNSSFHKFAKLALSTLQGKEVAIATRLTYVEKDDKTKVVLDTKTRKSVISNINSSFPGSEFAKVVGRAFLSSHEMNKLLGNKPELFFSSVEFNPALCHEFSEMFLSIIKGNEAAIGEKLGKLDANTKSKIGEKLENIHAKATEGNSSIRLIATAMNEAVVKTTPTDPVPSTTSSSSSSSSATPPASATPADTTPSMPSSSSSSSSSSTTTASASPDSFFSAGSTGLTHRKAPEKNPALPGDDIDKTAPFPPGPCPTPPPVDTVDNDSRCCGLWK